MTCCFRVLSLWVIVCGISLIDAGGWRSFPMGRFSPRAPSCSGKVTAVQVDAQAFWLRAPGCGEIRPVTLPEPDPDDVLVRTLVSGISRGTESLVFRGRVPPSQYETMRAPFQEGDFPGPV